MANFSYTARDKKGAVSTGSVFAADKTAAVASIIDKGLTPIWVKEEDPNKKAGVKAAGINLPFLNKSERVKLGEKVVFSRQFATMINAGVPIVQSLNVLSEQTPSKAFKAVLQDLANKVQAGTQLSAAMNEHPKVFPPVYVNMIKAGETGGILDQVLERLATQQEKDAEIVHKVRGAMIYPSVITAVTVGAFFFMMTVIVPRMATVFESFNAELPAYTKFLLATSKFMTQNLVIMVGGTVIGVIALLKFVKTPAGKVAFDNLLLRTPVFGSIVRKVNIARFARTFGSLMTSGIAVLDALNTTAQGLGNSVFKNAVTHMAQEVKNGKPIHETLKRSAVFPPIVAQMVSVGEETGKLDEILIKLAQFYESEVENIIQNLTSIIEPILIVVIGGMIGSIVIGVLGPLGSLSNAV
jgi:type IV pilus assembly protein PilC